MSPEGHSDRFQLGTHEVLATNRLMDEDGSKWLDVWERVYNDESGRERSWEYVARKPTNPLGDKQQDSLYIIALLKRPSSTSVVVELQYRPPLDAICVEFPAGFLKPDESIEDCVKRELYEETGYGLREGIKLEHQEKEDEKNQEPEDPMPRGGRVIHVKGVSEGLAREPGLSSTRIQRVTVVVPFEDDEQPGPKADRIRNSAEHIVVGTIDLEDLYDTLKGLEKRPGYVIGAELSSFADGLQAAKTLIYEESDEL